AAHRPPASGGAARVARGAGRAVGRRYLAAWPLRRGARAGVGAPGWPRPRQARREAPLQGRARPSAPVRFADRPAHRRRLTTPIRSAYTTAAAHCTSPSSPWPMSAETPIVALVGESALK